MNTTEPLKLKISDLTIESSLIDKARYWINPGVYIRNHSTSKLVSRKINSLLDCPETEIHIKDGYTIVLGGYLIWVQNFPYCYGAFVNHLSKDFDTHACLPDRKTVYRLWRTVEAAKRVHLALELQI